MFVPIGKIQWEHGNTLKSASLEPTDLPVVSRVSS